MFLILTLGLISCNEIEDPPSPITEAPIGANMVEVQVKLPNDSGVDLKRTKLFSLSVESSVNSEGLSEVPFNSNTIELAYLMDEDDNVLLSGFITDTKREISIESTTEVLFYMSFGTFLQPYEIKEKFIENVRTIPDFNGVNSEIEKLFLADKLMFSKASYAPLMKEKITLLTSTDTLDIRNSSKVEVNGADIRSGLQLTEIDFKNFTISNTFRRRTHAFIYKVGFKNKEGENTNLDPDNIISGSDNAIKNVEITSTTAIRGVLGVISDWSLGKGLDFAETVTQPIELPLAESESEATYKVRVIGPAKETTSPDQFTAIELDKLEQLQFETFVMDWFLPFITDVVGHNKLLDKINPGTQKDILTYMNTVMTNFPAINDLAKQGKFEVALDDLIFSLYNNKIGADFEEILINVFTKLGENIDSDVFMQNTDLIGKTIKKSAKIIEAFDIGLKLVDYARILSDRKESKQLEEWIAKAVAGNVKLTPRESKVIPFKQQKLTAITDSQPNEGAVLQYEWSTTGKYGYLTTTDNSHTGTSFTSNSKEVFYTSNAFQSNLSDGNNIEEVTVKVSIKMGPNTTNVGSATSIINVKKHEYVMKPVKPELQGKQSVKLYLERKDGVVDIAPNPNIDYKIIWSTTGKFGKLEGRHNNITKYDINSIVFENLDEEVIKGTDKVFARIYSKPKSENDYILFDVVEGEVLIDNDVLRKIFYIDRQVIGSPAKVNGIYCEWSVRSLFKFKPLDPVWLQKENLEVVNYRLTIEESVPDANPTYIGTGKTWLPKNESTDLNEDGDYIFPFGGTGAQGGAQYCEGTASSDYEKSLALYNSFKGYAKVVVTLKYRN